MLTRSRFTAFVLRLLFVNTVASASRLWQPRMGSSVAPQPPAVLAEGSHFRAGRIDIEKSYWRASHQCTPRHCSKIFFHLLRLATGSRTVDFLPSTEGPDPAASRKFRAAPKFDAGIATFACRALDHAGAASRASMLCCHWLFDGTNDFSRLIRLPPCLHQHSTGLPIQPLCAERSFHPC